MKNLIPAAANIPREEVKGRVERLASKLRSSGLQGAVVWSNGASSYDYYADVYYLTNHHATTPHIVERPGWEGVGRCAVVVTGDGKSVLVSSSNEHSDDEIVADEVRYNWNLPEEIANVLRDSGLARSKLGLIGRDALLYYNQISLKERIGPDCVFVPADELLDELRSVKSAAELDRMRYAGKVGARWMHTMMQSCKEGATEASVVADGLHNMVRSGGMIYDVGIASGPNASFGRGSGRVPHWNWTRTLERGDLVRCDAWGPVDGYYTDIMRSTIVGGKATAEQRRILDGSVELVRTIAGAIKVGRTFDDLYRTGIKWLNDNDLAPRKRLDGSDAFQCFGHGIGVNIERAHIVPGDVTEIRAGMVLAIEAAVALPGVGAAGYEDNFIVHDTGIENLTEECPAVSWE